MDSIQRGREAERLLSDPVLKEAFDALENSYLTALLENPMVTDDEVRKAHIFKLGVIVTRKVWDQLEILINEGKAEAHNLALEVEANEKKVVNL